MENFSFQVGMSCPSWQRHTTTDIRIECSEVYTLRWLESRAEILIYVLYSMDSAIVPDRHSASAERVDSSSVLVAKVSYAIRFIRLRAWLRPRGGGGSRRDSEPPLST